MVRRPFVLALVVTLSVPFQARRASVRDDLERYAPQRPAPSVVEVPNVALPPADAATIYEELQARNAKARPHLLHRYPASVQAAVWSHHFLTALQRYPEFNEVQRGRRTATTVL